MRVFYQLFFLLFCSSFFVCQAEDTKVNATEAEQLAAGEKRLGDHIRAILKHYQQHDPVGLPGAPIPDPMPVPDMKHSFSMYTMTFKQINVYGLSKFRIEHLKSELALMQVSAALSITRLDIRGLYTLASWLSRSAGNFTVILTGVNIEGVARLEVGADGKLQAQDIDMDLTFENIDMDFKNLGFLGSVFQGVINSISQLPQYFPNSISPFDMAVAEGRRQVSQMGYDPYRLKDYSQNVGIFTVMSSHTWITGLASFYRMGNITLSMENRTVYAVLDVGTQEIEGRTHWEVSVIGGVLSRAGTVSFTVQYFRVQLNLSQPLDTRKRPTLEELDLELGNIQARIHGAGTLDYVMEASINILPNLLRYQIMDAIEGPLKRRIQEELNNIDVEKLINEKIPEIEEHAKFLQGLSPPDEIILEDPVPPQMPDDLTPFSESEEERGPS
ncbi:hypothetical protein M0804_002206 [Polistes exclamans]|nr:hypothetical protein M0804_002206 [Polistes exclamans]